MEIRKLFPYWMKFRLQSNALSVFSVLLFLALCASSAVATTVATPTFSPAAGTYTSVQTVTISDSTSGAAIYYTTNGNTPTTSSTRYSSAITVSVTQTLKALATHSGDTNSAVGSAAYTINLPVIEWTWMSGGSTVGSSGGQNGVYGTKGTPAAGNVPGGRQASAIWSDSSGNLWVFGGSGFDSAGTNGDLNDLWKFTVSTSEWTWMGGSNLANQSGVYGTEGTPAAGNIPGSRTMAVNWSDSSGNLWLLGGWDSAGALNDLWKYSPSSNEWTWMGGSSSANQDGVYGTEGTEASGNVPGARGNSIGWIDSSGNLWLFGGYGFDSVGTEGDLNDLWEYTPSSNEWTWVSGSNTIGSTGGQSGVYGTEGTPAAGNVPGGRDSMSAWIDASGNFWIFGGEINYTSGGTAWFNDLWKFNPSTKLWAWMSGSSSTGQSGVYGTKGTPAAGNVPGSRDNTSNWTDSSGHLWLFGGTNNGGSTYLNDLWEFNTSTSQWAWMDGGSTTDQSGVYGTLGTPAAANTPGSQLEGANVTDINGNLWLFGGYGYDSTGAVGALNSLWKFQPTATTVVATPAFSPAAGTYSSAQSVTITDATSGATIYYTTNGTTPTTGSSVYSSAIAVSATETLKALATHSGDTNSAVGSAVYTINLPVVATPAFSPAAGTYSSAQSVTITDATSGATIYYTTNGSTPTTGSSVYSSAITISATETLEALATHSGDTNSAVASAVYTINLPVVATPAFSPAAGTYSSAQTVTISDSTSGATIYYTTNGSTPTTSSSVYSSAITVSATETLEALATHSGDTNSAVGSAAYTISTTVATPALSPGAGTYSSVQQVTISDTTSGASIYYTLSGTTPTTASAPYLEPVYVTTTETLSAIAVASGYTNSAVGSAAYTVSAGTPTRSFPTTSTTLLEFNDQTPLGSLSTAQIQFLATNYAGSQKQLASEATTLRGYNSDYLVLHYRLSEELGYGECSGTTPTETDPLTIIDGNNWVEEWAWPGNPAPAADASWFYQCDGTICTPSGSTIYDCGDQHWLMNITNTGWQNYYSQQVIKEINDNEDDGVFADSYSVPNYLGTTIWTPNLAAIDTSWEDAWATDMTNFTTYMRAQFNGNWRWIPNAGPYVTTRDPATEYNNSDGVMFEDFVDYGNENFLAPADWVTQMNRVLTLDNLNKVLLFESYPNSGSAATYERVYITANALLMQGEYTYLNLDTGGETLSWWPEYLISGLLGAPTQALPSTATTISGFAKTSGNGTTYYQRNFANGMVLVNPTGSDTGTISLGGTYYMVTGDSGGGAVPSGGTAPGTLSCTAVTSVDLTAGGTSSYGGDSCYDTNVSGGYCAAILLTNPNC